MRLTFPALSTNSSVNYCIQAALACLPLAVDLLAKHFFAQNVRLDHLSTVLGLGSLATLKNNKWALGGGTLLWGIYKLYTAFYPHYEPSIVISAPSDKSSSVIVEQPSPETPLHYAVTEVQTLAPSVIKYIEENCIADPNLYGKGGTHSIRKGSQVMDVFQSLIKLGSNKASKAGAIFKNLYKCLPTPLLQPIVEDLRNASKVNKNKTQAYKTAIEKLDENNLEIFRLAMGHLGRVTAHSDTNKLTPENVAIIFTPVFFKIETGHPLVEFQLDALTSILKYLIEHSTHL